VRSWIVDAFPDPGRTVDLPVESALGRILAAPVRSGFAVPSADVAEVDGVAVASRDTIAATVTRPVVIEDCMMVDTGRPLPPGTDAVVPIERCPEGAARLVLEAPVKPWDGVRRAGAELEDGAILLPCGHRIRPVDVGPLVAAGVTRVRVRTARVGVVPTGGELVPPGTVPGPGENIASNPVTIGALLAPQGAETVTHAVVPDDASLVRSAILDLCAGVDLVVVCGGSGRGRRDVAFGVVRSLGEIVVDGVAARPGRAFLVVRVGRTPVVALPGRARPVGLLTEYFLSPLLTAWGLPGVSPPRIRARLGLGIVSHPRFTETVPLSVATIGNGAVGIRQPRGRRGMQSQFRANARLLVPEGIGRHDAGDEVEVELLDDPSGPDSTVLVVGAVDELEIPPVGYRIAQVPCRDGGEVAALLDRTACHLAVLTEAPRPAWPAWPLRRANARDLWMAAPPVLADDPKVAAVLTALGITR
jgi:putative molybdopterin biosynthesis protein